MCAGAGSPRQTMHSDRSSSCLRLRIQRQIDIDSAYVKLTVHAKKPAFRLSRSFFLTHVRQAVTFGFRESIGLTYMYMSDEPLLNSQIDLEGVEEGHFRRCYGGCRIQHRGHRSEDKSSTRPTTARAPRRFILPCRPSTTTSLKQTT